MSLPLKLDFSNYDNFLTEPNYTTSAEAQDYFRNMDMLVEALIDVGLWQPETNYPNGHVVFSPNMPNGTEAVCVATNGGKSSNIEPSWGEVGGENISDGTCFWKLRWRHWSKDVEQITDLTTGATNRLPNTTYTDGNVVYNRSNLSVALKCTKAGTTSNDELDVSGRAVGDSVDDGSVVWKVIERSNVLDEGGIVPIANGGTGASTVANARNKLGLSTAVTGASISGKTITLTFADGTTKKLTTQDTNTSNWSISKNAKGYTKDNTTGLIIQWGTATAKTGNTFAIAFPSACYAVIPTEYHTSNTEGNTFLVGNVTKTGFSRYNIDRTAHYIAIGV